MKRILTMIATGVSVVASGLDLGNPALTNVRLDSGATIQEEFGYAAAMGGERIVVSALRADIEGSEQEMIYVYNPGGEIITTLICPEQSTVNNGFGSAVATNGSVIAVGCSGATVNAGEFNYNAAGAVYLFDADGNYLQKVTAPIPVAESGFGCSLALDGTTLVVGAQYETNGTGYHAGVVYVFDTAGSYQTTLTAPDAKPQDWFGNAVAIDGETIAIGAMSTVDALGDFAGAVYLFDTSGSFLRKIVSPQPVFNEHFGNAVALNGSTLVVGAYCHSQKNLLYRGAGYLFTTEGLHIATLTAQDTTGTRLYLGQSVYANASIVALGCPGYNSNDGVVMVYDHNGNYLRGIALPGTTDGQWGHGLAGAADSLVFTGIKQINGDKPNNVGGALVVNSVTLETLAGSGGYGVNDDYSLVDPMSDPAVRIYPPSLLTKLTNPVTDFENNYPKNGVLVTADTHPLPESVFYGMYQIEFALSTHFSNGDIVDILAKKPEQSTFIKVGELVAADKPVDETPWVQQYYWNTRENSFEWDGLLYKTAEAMQFRFIVK